MNKKNQIIWGIFLLVALVGFAILGYFVLLNNSEPENNPSGAIAPVEKVDPFIRDQNIYGEALLTRDTDKCSVLMDVELQSTCLRVISDLVHYDEAVTQLNLDICDLIVEPTREDACVNMVGKSVEHFEENDPSHLAGLYSFVHNEKAIEQYEELLNSDPDNIDNILRLIYAYAEKGLKEQEQGNDQLPYVEKAISLAKKAKDLQPKLAEIYVAEAYAYEIKPDYVRSIDLYSEAIELDSKNIDAYVGRGHAKRLIGTLQDALDDFYKANKLDKKNENIVIYTNLCLLEHAKGEKDTALEYCQIVINREGSDPTFRSSAYQILANMARDEQKYKEASSYLSNSIILSPKDSNIYVELAKLNIYEGKYDESEKNARKAIELVPTKTYGYLALSQALYMQEKYDDSIVSAKDGLTFVWEDVSLLLASKPAVERDLYYSIANNYRQINDTTKQLEYEKLAEDAFPGL